MAPLMDTPAGRGTSAFHDQISASSFSLTALISATVDNGAAVIERWRTWAIGQASALLDQHLTVASEFNAKIEGPLYCNLLGPTQWPSEGSLPEFAPLVQQPIKEVAGVANTVRGLAAKAMGIDNRLLDQLFDAKQQYRGRMIKYPSPPADADPAAVQALGAHQDTAFATLICQLTDHISLQVQNAQGTWIDCPPVPGYLHHRPICRR
ncbi:hypothetical protein BO82DRAFT_397311 [Aspergillus uvarum CBS 121591]|uniref:Clavaminate synthase-like protein n=1 Tax=Aspergillus uvarum CBS 121591 TaxID=1448315 RepID=A0A319CNJ5_9EURO|nr:hypothetical protein BO82DRAFT_397311 [Aspergillus uvarum CBS 121591]PYH86734.1 hypothetical protein BO82DRAFT_397311 [Aspergillus uvarum CBS 121591]